MLSKLLQNKRNRIFLMIAGLVVVAGAGLLVYRLFIYKAPVETGTEEALQTVTVKRGDLEIADSLSHETVRSILKKANLSLT